MEFFRKGKILLNSGQPYDSNRGENPFWSLKLIFFQKPSILEICWQHIYTWIENEEGRNIGKTVAECQERQYWCIRVRHVPHRPACFETQRDWQGGINSGIGLKSVCRLLYTLYCLAIPQISPNKFHSKSAFSAYPKRQFTLPKQGIMNFTPFFHMTK